MKYSILVCAKAQSERLPGKNLLPLAGKPLIEHTFDFIRSVFDTSVKNIWIVSDSNDILQRANNYGFGGIREPKEYVNNNHNMPLMRWIHGILKSDKYIMLPPTSPVRDGAMMDFISHFLVNDIKSGHTVYNPSRGIYRSNGALFMWRADILDSEDIIGASPRLYVDKYDFDINTKEDFSKVEKYLIGE